MMQKLQCQHCGSLEIYKEGEFFICDSCGAKYTPEAAKNLVVSGEVKITDSTVVINNGGIDVEKHKQLAQRAYEFKQYEEAYKLYNEILTQEPDYRIATYRAPLARVLSKDVFKINERDYEGIKRSYQYVMSGDENEDTQVKAECLVDFVMKCCQISADTTRALKNSRDVKKKVAEDRIDAVYYILQISICGKDAAMSIDDMGDAHFREVKGLAAQCVVAMAKTCREGIWYTYREKGTDHYSRAYTNLITSDQLFQIEKENAELTRQYDPSFTYNPKKGGCYVATAVYGSYDCPQVWTLRRYRDYNLDVTTSGRLFIRVYYALSPIAVKLFGKSRIFKAIFKPWLDRKVAKLNALGYDDTPYHDKY